MVSEEKGGWSCGPSAGGALARVGGVIVSLSAMRSRWRFSAWE